MHIVFGSHPFEPRQPDPAYEPEYHAAVAARLPVHVISTESLIEEQDGDRTVRWIRAEEAEVQAIFRGYMLTGEQYGLLYDSLLSRNIRLINSPAQYEHCHYLPNYYAQIRAHTPESVWFPVEGQLDIDVLRQALVPFGNSPVVVKDFVKSEKHYWREACFIPSAADFSAAERIVRRLLELRGRALNIGVVIRRFVELAKVGIAGHDMPVAVEARVFVMNGKPLLANPYWTASAEMPSAASIAGLLTIVASTDSNLFTMDMARTVDGSWLIIELGDGQVAGLPPGVAPSDLFSAIANAAA